MGCLLRLLIAVLRVGLALVMAAVLALAVSFGAYSLHRGHRIDQLRDRPGAHIVDVDVADTEAHCAKACSYAATGYYDPPGPSRRQDVSVYPDYNDDVDGKTVRVFVAASDPSHGVAAGATSTSWYVYAALCLLLALFFVVWLPGRWLLRRRRARATKNRTPAE